MKLNKRSAWRGAIPATPLRRNVGLTYIAAYVAVLLSCTRIWSADPTLLYVGRDADFSIWLASAYLDWARPFGVTALNPFQGMGSMLMPMNPHFNPGAWIFQSDLGLSTKFVVSMAVYFVEVTVSCFVLGITLGFSRAFSFAAALWLVVLFLPPFNFVFGLQGIVATSPQWANTLALCNLILTLFILIGNHNWSARGSAYSCAINAALATGVVVLALVCLLTAPFYGAATMSGLVLLCAVVLLASLARRAFVEAPVAGPLTPARDVRLVFERSGVRITASSDGTSMLLLPLQFSHCLHASDPKVRVTRADLIFTLIQFNEHLDERLNWEFSFWRQSECRMKDVADLRKLGLVR
jgi:hypothetical protein